MSDERERMAEIIADSIDMDWKPGYAADALIAAGYGDVAKARAETVEKCAAILDDEARCHASAKDGFSVRQCKDRAAKIRALAQPKEPGDVAEK